MSASAAIDPRGVRSTQRRFAAINEERLRRVYEFLKPQQKAFLDILPLLFHVNHPELPGYVDDDTPAGLAEYQPTPEALKAAKVVSPGFDHKKKAHRYFNIHSLFSMGSAGSVAYSEKSDFDMWLCHWPELGEEGLAKLQEKCIRIEKWGDSLGLEVHFFLMNADTFRGGEQVALSSESSGTAQHHFLLDEFYRSSLLMGGRYPVWWLVPPEEEAADYEAYVARLYQEGGVSENEVIDFGGLGHIPSDEFYGASVWQVYKGISSPYKSVLKILLMEAYTSEYPGIELLSLRFKRMVMEGERDFATLDPYLMMMSKLERYLESQQDQERLDLARRCFYFKVGEPLSRGNRRPHDTERFELLSGLGVSWGWDRAWLYTLDSRPTWKVERVLEERKSLVGALTRSYHALSAFARNQAADMMIDPKDLNLLGRKLYSAFERKAGKIELINPGISSDLSEEYLTFYRAAGEQEAWFLYRGDAADAKARQRVGAMKRTPGLVELIAWCHFNGILTHRTQVFAYSRRGRLDAKQVQEVITHFEKRFPDGEIPEPTMEDFSKPDRIVASSVVINAGEEGVFYSPQAMQFSNNSDAFNFGPNAENLVRTIDLVVVTSWHEILTYHFSGDSAVLGAVGEYLNLAKPSDATPLPKLGVNCFSFFQAGAISQRVERLFERLVGRFRKLGEKERLRYVAKNGGSYYLLEGGRDGTTTRAVGALEQLRARLAAPSEAPFFTQFDPSAARETPMAEIVGHYQPGRVRFFYSAAGGQAEVYVLDENGSLFRQLLPFHDAQTLLIQFHRFFSSVLPRRDASLAADPASREQMEVEYYQLVRGDKSRWGVRPLEIDESRQLQRYFSVQVIGEVGDGGSRFTIYCDNREFSSLEHGNRLFTEIARYILDRRNNGERYPIYITDIDISRLLNRGGRGIIQTIQFLNYKQRIEERLNAALQAL